MKTIIKKYSLAAAFIGLATILIFNACQRDDLEPGRMVLNLPETKLNYVNIELPSPFENEKIEFQKLTTDEGATLGRVLFYDPALSLSNTISCGSCHFQELGFADGREKSQGYFVEKTRRNSPGFSNLSMANQFFWDGRAKTLEEQVIMPIQDHIEMGIEDMDELVEKLASKPYYPDLFKDAFGDEKITEHRIASGLSQFLRSIWSVNSINDRANSMDQNAMSESARRGKFLFEQKFTCGSCHQTSLSRYGGSSGQTCIGLDHEYEDNGMGELDAASNQFGFPDGYFKIPSLRNVALTAPYMHDGRFATLMEVVEFYNSGIQNHPNLDFRLKEDFFNNNSGPKQMNMTEQEKKDIVAFMHTLTDMTLISDQKFSNPFVEE
jgi:cytochrome c peroxidase